jgi:hypothetical protein
LLTIAIAFYPGGNINNLAHDGFSLRWNVMCDLGENLAMNGVPNQLSQALFRASSIILSVSVAIFFCVIWIFFKEKKITKILSLSGTSMIIVAASLFIVVILIPQIFEITHMTLLIIAPIMEFLAIFIYTAIFWRDKRFPKINRIAFLIMSISALTFLTLIIIGVSLGGDLDFQFRRSGHTLFTYIVAFGYTALGIGSYLYIKR